MLDLSPLQGVGIDLEPNAPAPVYELSSILVHKGTSAFHGHYGTLHADIGLRGFM